MARETMMWAIVDSDGNIGEVYHTRYLAERVRDEQYGPDYSVRRARVILDDAEEAREG